MNIPLLPLRGKFSNAFSHSKAEFFNNAEVQAIQQIMYGHPYDKNQKIEDCKVSKVIFLCDADVDGAHISVCLLRNFVMYYPQMIIHKMVYKAIPPLYAIKANGKDKYFTDQRDIVKYIQRTFQQKYTVTNLDNSPLTNVELTNLFLTNADYIYWLKEMIANNYSVHPKLLEVVLYNYLENGNAINLKKLEKEIGSLYRFMGVQKINNSFIVSGTIDKSYYLPFNDAFVQDNCTELFKIIANNKALRYKVNGQIMTLYDIMSLYEDTSPTGVKRFKGLGEMEDYQLKESTLYPGSDRTLICYTMDDAKAELESIREYESDMKKFLKLAKNVTRDDLID